MLGEGRYKQCERCGIDQRVEKKQNKNVGWERGFVGCCKYIHHFYFKMISHGDKKENG
jgi:hypothetical protein